MEGTNCSTYLIHIPIYVMKLLVIDYDAFIADKEVMRSPETH
jgi:hypothetical protein